MASVDTDKILSDATKKLEDRFLEVQELMRPLREEEAKLAETINRLTGQYPKNYAGAPAASRKRPSSLSDSDLATAIVDHIRDSPKANISSIVNALGVSRPKATTAVDALIEAGQIRTEGKGAGRKLFVN